MVRRGRRTFIVGFDEFCQADTDHIDRRLVLLAHRCRLWNSEALKGLMILLKPS